MPKNIGRGGKNYKRGKHSGPVKRDLSLKDPEENTVYGVSEKMLGNGRVMVRCFDEVTRLGNIRGKMKRKVWIGPGDLLLCSLRDQAEKCDILLKYTPDEIRQLKAMGEVPQDLEVKENTKDNKSSEIEFQDKDDDENGNSEDDIDSSNPSDDDSDNDGDTFQMGNLKERYGKFDPSAI